MPTRLIDWMVRTVMLALAGLVTLSILGSIAAISNQSGGFVVDRRERPPAEMPAEPEDRRADPTTERPSPAPAPDRAVERTAAGAVGDPISAEIAGAEAEDQRTPWLEAIAYALLALAGLFALAILLLWRGLRQLARIAEAQQTRSRNQ